MGASDDEVEVGRERGVRRCMNWRAHVGQRMHI